MNTINALGYLLTSCLFVYMCSTHSINVKIIKETTNLRPDLNNNIDYNDIKNIKTNASVFSGPTDLQYLVGKCYTYSTNKYVYRVCPFDNITQHEKHLRSGAYNGVIGVWKEWMVVNNSFDSLVFSKGDDCGESVERNAKLMWICNRDINEPNDIIVNITEPIKCLYEILFASEFGCENKYIYRYLSEKLRQKWDRIETNYHYNQLTQLGYESALHEVFVESGIIANKIDVNFETKDKCLENFIFLKTENQNLMNRINYLENELKNKN